MAAGAVTPPVPRPVEPPPVPEPRATPTDPQPNSAGVRIVEGGMPSRPNWPGTAADGMKPLERVSSGSGARDIPPLVLSANGLSDNPIILFSFIHCPVTSDSRDKNLAEPTSAIDARPELADGP